MTDLSLNENFSVHLDDRNDLATVDGREAFEQSVAVMLTDFMYDSLPGLKKEKNIKGKIRLQVNRVARQHEFLDNVEDLDIEPRTGQPQIYDVRIYYSSAEPSLISGDESTQ